MAAGSNNIVTDGLIFCADPANKRCYSGSGDTCTDLAGGVTGDFVNDTSLSSDWNGVFDFDGTDDYIDFGSPAALQNQVGTVIGWGRWDETNTDQGGLVSYLYAHGSLAHGWNLLNHGTYQIGRSLAGSHYDYWTGSSSYKFDKDEWVMASFSFAGNSNPVITYRNDVAINTDSSQGTTVTYTGAKVLIGRTDVSAYREWRGQIGPVYIYNRVLTQDEITQMYEAMKPRFTPRIPKEGLMGYWDAGDPQCFDGSMVNQYSPGTWNLIDLCSGTVGEFDNGNPLPNFSLDNGGYWTFDGTDDGIWAGKGVADSMYEQYSNVNGITGIMWMNLASDGLNVFFWKDDMFQFRYDSSSKLNMRTGNGSSWSTSADLKSAADLLTTDGSAWACVAASANKSNDAREIWLNGERVANDTGSGMVWGTDNATMGVAGGWGSDTLDGKVGMALLYSRALSAAEIKDFYNKTKARFGH